MNQDYYVYTKQWDEGLDEPPEEWLDIQEEYEKIYYLNNYDETDVC